MYLPDVELHEATKLEQAAALMARLAPNAQLLAGGTDLLVDLKTSRVSVDHLVCLRRIDALRGLSNTGGGLRIGALTTITQLQRSPLVAQGFAPLLDAAQRMAAPQIRNLATVGGNVACAVPCADLPPILTAMNAAVTLFSTNGRRNVPLEAFFVGARRTSRRDDEVLTAVLVPKPPPGFGAAYARFALRDGNAIAVAAVAAGLTLNSDQTIQDARIVLGAVAPVPLLVEPAGATLVGQPPAEDAFNAAADAALQAAEPISDVRGSADFRRHLVGVLTKRALAAAYRRAQEAK